MRTKSVAGSPHTSTLNAPHAVIELRNVAEIVRAVRYVEEEIQTHFELDVPAMSEEQKLVVRDVQTLVKAIWVGQTNLVLSESVDGLLGTLDELENATRSVIESANEQVRELTADVVPSPAVPISMIETELARRAESRNLVADIQEGYEDKRDKIKEQLASLEQELRIAPNPALRKQKKLLEASLRGFDNTINGIVDAVAENDRKVGILTNYRNAVALVAVGISSGIIGEKLFDIVNVKSK